ncbi:hypothetical protein QFC22_000383 [Naganishia vaughanmartiniae]|uniref:Uncharacterized protein n=1 Tax=Naganishia vaughanmartiniae TaxID=1424756 RepID=A0ACC2XN64_9TREE|nr:hypothetical protein QFC22_000383 [Naganishia vaughanmartiniae]
MSGAVATTPSRGGPPKKYIPFNHDPKNVGSRTGRPMPEHIPRNPEGFEDIDAFFDSPERDESTRSGVTSVVTDGDTRRTIASTMAASSTRTEIIGQRSVRVGAKGRLSMMADDDDAQDRVAEIDGFIDEDVNVNFGDESGSRSMDIVTPSKSRCPTDLPSPGSAFVRSKRHRPPHSTSPGQTFSLSQLQEREEDVYPAALASASRTNGHTQSRNMAGLGVSSRRPPAQSPRQLNGASRGHAKTAAAVENDESEPRTARIAPATPIAEQTRRRPAPRAGSDDSSPPREGDVETPNAVEQSRNAMFSGGRASEGGLSKASRRSHAAPSTAGDVTEDDQELDVQYDDQIDESLLQQPDASSPENPTRDIDNDKYGDRDNEPEQDAAGYDDQADDNLGQVKSPVQNREGEGNESEGASPPPVNRKKGKGKAELKGKATAKRKPLADATNQRKKRTARPDPDETDENGETGPQKKRSRSANIHREPVHKPADEGGASYLRTARERHKPLDWWRGERPVIKRQIVNGEVGPAFITAEWLTIPEEKAIPLAAKRKGGARRARSGTAEPVPKKARKKQTSDGSDDGDQEPEADDVTGWDEGTEPGGMVMDFTTGQEVMRRVANTSAMVRPKEIPNASFTYQKIFGEDEFFAAGILRIEVGGCKAPKNSRDNAYVFFVQQGCVEVTIHRTRFLMSEGGAFLIPRGNQYGFSNVCQKEVHLCFSQARRIKAEEDIPLEETLNNNQTINAAGGNKTRRESVDGADSARREQQDDDEDEDSPPPVQKKRPVAKKTVKR